jgi:ribonuclease VapC
MRPVAVLDASALLALLKREPGHVRVVAAILDGAALATVNLSEVIAVFSRAGTPAAGLVADIERLGLLIEPFTRDDATHAGELIPQTSAAGLSFGDRACLALAMRIQCPVLTADRAWADLNIDVGVTLIR